jgi:ribonuclease BN (tRNA processing enzyme)
MRVTVLGKSPAWQDAGGACSGYLVEEEGCALVVDCGNGAFAKLRERVDYTEVDAVVISHMHADHFFDLFPFAYGLLLTPRQQPVPVAGWPGTSDPARPRLITPIGGRPTVRSIASAWGDEALVESAFHLEEYEASSTLEVGPFRLRFAEVPHYILTFAIEVRNAAGRRVTFGADCRPNDAIVDFARDTDLLVIEATLPRPERTGIRGHLTPEEAGEHARRAGAKRALLTHVSDELDPDWIKAQGEAGFGGPVELASEGLALEI